MLIPAFFKIYIIAGVIPKYLYNWAENAKSICSPSNSSKIIIFVKLFMKFPCINNSLIILVGYTKYFILNDSTKPKVSL